MIVTQIQWSFLFFPIFGNKFQIINTLLFRRIDATPPKSRVSSPSLLSLVLTSFISLKLHSTVTVVAGSTKCSNTKHARCGKVAVGVGLERRLPATCCKPILYY